jgi:hypothetical protein
MLPAMLCCLLLQGRQSFSLHNVKLAANLGGVVVTLAFR